MPELVCQSQVESQVQVQSQGECLVELGLAEALNYVERQRNLCGEDLGITFVDAWCRSQWRRFQRRCRVEHLFGKRQYSQFPAEEFGNWSEDDRELDQEFDLVVGKYESGSENLDFVCWPGFQRVSQEARDHFATLDPNWPRFGNEVIIQMAKEILPPPKSARTAEPLTTF
jgi:hypothetical protein